MASADWHGRTVATHTDSATPHEVTLVEATLAHRLVRKTPERLIGDNAYESDQLDAELAQRGIELIAPHRRNRRRRTQDAGWSPASPVSTPMEDGTAVCVVTELSTNRRAVRTLPGQFPGHVAPCVLADLAAGVYEMTSSL